MGTVCFELSPFSLFLLIVFVNRLNTCCGCCDFVVLLHRNSAYKSTVIVSYYFSHCSILQLCCLDSVS